MYDSFDNMYQATIGIDFLSKASLSQVKVTGHTSYGDGGEGGERIIFRLTKYLVGGWK